jgi:hypothetical protein
MWRCAVLLLAAMVCLWSALAKDSEPLKFVLPVPTNWPSATRIRLLLEGVTVPGNVPLKLRVTTIGPDGQEVFVGSTGIEALGRDESKPRPLPVLQLDVTRSLRRLLETRAGEKNIELRVQVVDGRNKPIPDLKWSCDKARLEIQDKANSQ